jgi:two-component sensor histidine kinase
MDQLELRISALCAVSQARMLVREIDHRVKNSLQFVSGMLSMQARAATETHTFAVLKEASDRVMAVARVHRHFDANEPTERVACLQFLRRICADLAAVLGTAIHVDGVEAIVPATAIQPIGLIVNEFVLNAAKHGAGHVAVTFKPTENGKYALSVTDEGAGLPSGFDIQRADAGLGMKLVKALSAQLKGSVDAGPNPAGRGTHFTVEFPLA